MRRNILDYIAIVILMIGGLVFALAGLFNFEIVSKISSLLGVGATIIYIIVGIAALYSFRLFRRY